MAQFREFLPSENAWIHDLARSELHPDAERALRLGQSLDPAQLIEEKSLEFLAELRGYFTDFAKLFNHHAEGGARFPEVKLYQVAHTPGDFILFRNTIKLVVSNPSHGVIRFTFAGHGRSTGVTIDGLSSGETSTVETDSSRIPQAQELLAQVGPFREVFFSFQGEKVDAARVARYYFAEFVRATRDTRKNRVPNQVVLDQVRALLKERGLDF
jgi:hypothetical protein